MLSVNGFRAALKYLTMFKEGMICTVSLSFLTVVFGFLLALVLALMRMSRVKPLSIFASIYVEVFRATPMLVQLFIIYYIVFGGVSLPSFKLFGFIRFERFLPGVISLALNSAAYLSEIIRAGIESVDRGQMEASRSLGLSYGSSMALVVVPQAVRTMIPSIINQFIITLKDTSILSVIAFPELTLIGKTISGNTLKPLQSWAIVGVMYMIVIITLSKLAKRIERRVNRGR